MRAWQGVQAVLSAFFGVRRKADAREDSQLSPLQLILTARFMAATFIGVLLLVVRLATS